MPVVALCAIQYVLLFNVLENRRRFHLRKRLQSYYIFLNYASFEVEKLYYHSFCCAIVLNYYYITEQITLYKVAAWQI